MLGGRLAVGGRDDEGLAGAADAGAGRDDVEAGPVAIGGEEAGRLALRIRGLTGLLGQADRGERASDAEPLVLGDRRAVRSDWRSRRAVATALSQVGAGLRVDRDADGDVVSVVADSALGNGPAGRRLDQGGIGDDLEPIRRPGHGVLALSTGLAALVLVGDQ